MYKNYFIVAFRNLIRNKTFTFINVFGLALSMSVCLLVLMRLKDQLSYDDFHKNSDRLYRITTKVTNPTGQDQLFATTPILLSEKLQKDYALVEDVARISPLRGREYTDGKKKLKLNTAFTDPGFFKLFSFRLEAGNKTSVLNAPNSIVLTHHSAQNFFGKEQAIGKILTIKDVGDLVVTGVLAETTDKSHIEFDGYISMNTLRTFENAAKLPKLSDDWNRGTESYTYVMLKDQASVKQLEAATASISAFLLKDMKLKGRESMLYRVQPFDKIILGEEMMFSMGNTGTMGKVGAEIAIGLVILLSACFNYTNLSIARSVNRGKEVGVRKVAGAMRGQIFQQFIIESVVLTMLSLGVGYLILRLLTDYSPLGQEMGAPDSAYDPMLFLWFF
ncbi:MAG: ABC transporter permease, partial [Gemmatimonadaceae bacterium]|nr:ABC transporter permease [Chitinophagaceae bacterium]